MGSAREALIEKYRVTSLERVHRIGDALGRLAEGAGTDDDVREAARELHTFKGESRMLGFARFAELAHAAESLLRVGAGAGGGGRPADLHCRFVADALEPLVRALRAEGAQADAAAEEVAAARERLLAAARSGITAPEGEGGAAAGRGGAAPEAPALAPAASPPPAPSTAAEQPSPTTRWVQLPTARVDGLCEQVAGLAQQLGRLRTQLLETPVAAAGGGATGGDALGRHPEGRAHARAVREDLALVWASLAEVESATWALRLSPIEPVLQALADHARDLAREQGKSIRVAVQGGGAEVERDLLDEIFEPLHHLVRNAVDHGIEPVAERAGKDPVGTLRLHGEPSGADVILTVADDGRGLAADVVRRAAVAAGRLTADAAAKLEPAALRELLFEHGFSTRTEAGAVSGRGVGLDVVRTRIETLGGTVRLDGEPGTGMACTLVVPSTVSRERLLVLQCAGALWGIASRHVLEIVRLDDVATEEVGGRRCARVREERLPLASLGAALGGTAPAAGEPRALIVASGGQRWAISVPPILGEYELLRRPLAKPIDRHPLVGGSATLPDGRLVLLLALSGLLRHSGRRRDPPAAAAPAPVRRRQRVLVVDDAPIARHLLGELLARAGLDVLTAQNGREALALLERETPDLVIADVEMPVLDGFGLLAEIRGRWRWLPVVMFTTRGADEDRRRAISLGANAYLVKTEFQEETVLSTVRRFLKVDA